MRTVLSLLALVLVIACTFGCSKSVEGQGTGVENGDSGPSGGPSGSAGAADRGGTGLPCEVEALLQHYCVGCHSSPPVGGAPEALLSYEDLIAPATLDPSQEIGAYSVALMQSGVMPPKPAAPPTASEITAVAAWVAAGMPRGGCTPPMDAGSLSLNPYDTPLKCTSGATWPPGNGSDLMEPGGACIGCHLSSEEAPTYSIAGTVYPSAHEPDRCNGTATSSSGALSVLITEASGVTHTLPVDSAGNFFYDGTIATPFHAQVQAGDQVRVMVHTQTSGDCNGCHTVNGSSNTPGATSAPGRVMAP